MKNLNLKPLAVLTFALLLSVYSSAKEISTDDIIESATSCTDCIDWRISGMCFWLKCTPFGCDIETSVRVTHFLPDAVVSSYSELAPWSETADWNPTNGASLTTKNTIEDTTIDFKHVTVIGNPALLVLDQLSNNDYFCSSGETPFEPFFLSALDETGWHRQIPELLYPQALSGSPAIGSNSGHWQNLYPRCGWTSHPDDPKSAAVAALRAAHIVSRSGQPHIYLPMSNDCGDDKKCWPPEEIEHENSDFKWQMITPVEQDTGEAFGESNVGNSWSNGKNTPDEQYAWHLWRKYSCCEPKGAFLYSVEFEQEGESQ